MNGGAKKQKYRLFRPEEDSISSIAWQEIHPDGKHTWLTEGLQEEFEDLIPLGTKAGKKAREAQANTIFQTYSLGVSTNRMRVVYDFRQDKLSKRVEKFINDYNEEVYQL